MSGISHPRLIGTRSLSRTLAMPPMATVTASSRLPVLPLEIWATILRNYSTDLEGLSHLWTQCRQVSKHFRAEVEFMFLKYYLPMVSLNFIIESKIKMWTTPYHVYQTHYVELLEDNKTALFSVRGDEQTRADLRNKVTKKIQYCRLDLGEFIGCAREAPFVTMRKDKATFEMDWKELFNRHFLT